MARYTLIDLRQSLIGSFLAVIIFLAIRGKNPFFFNPIYGGLISIALVWIYYKGFNGTKTKKIHFLMNCIVSFIVCLTISGMFGLITLEQALSREVLGSLVTVAWWTALPSALVFDKFNITNPLRRWYVRRGR